MLPRPCGASPQVPDADDFAGAGIYQYFPAEAGSEIAEVGANPHGPFSAGFIRFRVKRVAEFLRGHTINVEGKAGPQPRPDTDPAAIALDGDRLLLENGGGYEGARDGDRLILKNDNAAGERRIGSDKRSHCRYDGAGRWIKGDRAFPLWQSLPVDYLIETRPYAGGIVAHVAYFDFEGFIRAGKLAVRLQKGDDAVWVVAVDDGTSVHIAQIAAS